MAYILKRRRPTAKQSYNTFKAVTRIAELANGDKETAESLLSKVYYKAVSVAAAEPGRMVTVFPPDGDGLWTWNRSFDIACDVASQVADAEVPICIPEEAHIFIGKDLADMSDDERKSALDALDFAFADVLGGNGNARKMKDDEDAVSNLVDKDEARPKWLGDFGGADDMIRRNSILLDIEEEPELPKERAEWEQEADDLEKIMQETPGDEFANFLVEKMEERDLTPARLARKANMMTSTIVKLKNAENPVPTKSQILALGFALELDKDEFTKLLLLTGYCLSTSVPRDRIVSYYLDHGVYAIERINRALFVNRVPTLGTHAPVSK